ncbi:MAG: ABC transporter ATP-binding protein [Bryobacterales bacterium]|nr:ABC transporter ATP-binding protein [Bryobacterales bacterium]
MNSEFAIEAFGLEKNYGVTRAVRGVTFCVAPGQVTAFVGQNGAGKSSTLRMLLGFAPPTKGTARVLGEPVGSLRARSRIAYVAENKPLYRYMTVAQIIRFTKSFYSDWDEDAERRLLEEYELPLERRVSSLSKGMRTKVALLLALARRADLVILDEPSEGLDPGGIEHLLGSLAARAADGAAVFFSSHQIAEVERIADHVLMMHQGQLALDATMDSIRSDYRLIQAVFEKMPAEGLVSAPGVERVTTTGRTMQVLASSNTDEIVARLRQLESLSVEVAPADLREVFLGKAGKR